MKIIKVLKLFFRIAGLAFFVICLTFLVKNYGIAREIKDCRPNNCSTLYILPPYRPIEIVSVSEQYFWNEPKDWNGLEDSVLKRSVLGEDRWYFFQTFEGEFKDNDMVFLNYSEDYIKVADNSSFIVLDQEWTLGLIISFSILSLCILGETIHFLHKEFPSKQKKLTS